MVEGRGHFADWKTFEGCELECGWLGVETQTGLSTHGRHDPEYISEAGDGPQMVKALFLHEWHRWAGIACHWTNS